MPYIWAKKLSSIGEQIGFFHCIRFSYIFVKFHLLVKKTITFFRFFFFEI